MRTCLKVPGLASARAQGFSWRDVVRCHPLRRQLPHSLWTHGTPKGQREPYCMALVLASRSEYFRKPEQFHFILAIDVLFRDLDLNLAAPGEILIHLLAAYVACRETKLEGCADSIKTNTCYRHETTQLRLHYALNIDSERAATLRNGGSGAQCGDCNKETRPWPCFDMFGGSII